ncbi:MAG TPA: AbrB/MazE/SpoVT family DNA-binding domain-containing protein [Silvibacterium sp.]|nr:AbrB/MazE/SpoVT family DNA-binding domain-containing protein [Silvibacterium sp.]
MNATVTIDKAGRLVVPKPMRDALHIKAGDALEIQREGEQLTIRQKPARAKAIMENGVWVFDTGGRITNQMVNDVLEQTRREREARILGE